MLTIPLEDSIFTLQKLYLSSHSSDVNFQHYFGKCALVKVSPNCDCVCQLIWKKDLHHGFCQIDDSVLTFNNIEETNDCLPCKPVVKSFHSINSGDIKVISTPSYVKNATLSVIFDESSAATSWNLKLNVLSQVVANILRPFVVVNSCVVNLKNLFEGVRAGITVIVVHNLGFYCESSSDCGKISSSTKLHFKKLLSREKFIQLQNATRLGYLGGLDGPYSYLKKIINNASIRGYHSSLKFCNQVLLIGPSGSGKTSLVQKVTADCDAMLIMVLGPEVYSPKPGDTEAALRHLFKRATELALEGTCVILLDEVDILCPRRELKNSNSHVARTVAQLLMLLEEADKIQNLIIIATTSRSDAIDPAIRRPGRLEKEIYIGVPNEYQRKQILTVLIEPLIGRNCNDELDKLCSKVAAFTPGYVGADLSLLCQLVAQKISLCTSTVQETELGDWLVYFKKTVSEVRPSALRGGVGIIAIAPKNMKAIGGLKSVKQSLETIVTWPLLYPEAFARLNVPQPRGVLLYGPPGCAKTSLACALATSSSTTFLSISAAELYSPFFGDAEKTVVELFHRARLGAPSILFIDEIDAMVGNRAEKETNVQERILSTFLTEMDGVGVKLEKTTVSLEDETKNFHGLNSSGVVVIAATNRPDKLDDALLRPGRFDKLLYVPPPDTADRLDILKKLLSKTPLADCVDLQVLAESTEFHTGADLMYLCKEAALLALAEEGMDANCVRQQHFLKALIDIHPSLNKHLIDWFENYNEVYRK